MAKASWLLGCQDCDYVPGSQAPSFQIMVEGEAALMVSL